MEARDSGSKIRPLPIDDIDGDARQQHPIEPQRRLLPLIVIVAGAIAFAVIARGLGVGDTTDVGSADTTTPPANLAEEPEPTTTTTTSPPPPPLRQLLPVATDGLLLVTMSNTTARVGGWEFGSVSPGYWANISSPLAAVYNSDGTKVAVHTSVRNGSVIIDSTGAGAPTHVNLRENITGTAWHPSEPTLLAWTEHDANDAFTVIKVIDLSAGTATPEPLVEIVLDGGPHQLLAWGDWGFVTDDLSRNRSTVSVLDADGLNPVLLEGDYFDVSDAGVILMARIEEMQYIPYLIESDRSETALTGLDVGATDYRITSDGEWVLALTPQADGHTSILARTVRSRFTRLTSVDEEARIVGESPDDRYLILQETGTGDLIFKDWNTRAEYRIPFDENTAAVFF